MLLQGYHQTFLILCNCLYFYIFSIKYMHFRDRHPRPSQQLSTTNESVPVMAQSSRCARSSGPVFGHRSTPTFRHSTESHASVHCHPIIPSIILIIIYILSCHFAAVCYHVRCVCCYLILWHSCRLQLLICLPAELSRPHLSFIINASIITNTKMLLVQIQPIVKLFRPKMWLN